LHRPAAGMNAKSSTHRRETSSKTQYTYKNASAALGPGSSVLQTSTPVMQHPSPICKLCGQNEQRLSTVALSKS